MGSTFSPIKVLNDRGKLGNKRGSWAFGIGNEAEEVEVQHYTNCTYATAKRAAIARAAELGCTVVECYRDDPAPTHRPGPELLRKRFRF